MFCVKCGKENPDSGSFCWSCGSSLFKDSASSQTKVVLSASTTSAVTAQPAAVTALQHKGKLIVPNGAKLPSACVKCGASGIARPFRFAWLSPGYYLLIFLGIFPYVLIRLLLRKRVRILVPLCETHGSHAHRLKIITIITLVSAIPVGFIVGAAAGEDSGFLLFGLLVVAGTVLLWVYPPLRPIFIDKTHATFDGACDEFLRLVPDCPKYVVGLPL